MDNLNLDGFGEFMLLFFLFGMFAAFVLTLTIIFTCEAAIRNHPMRLLAACWLVLLIPVLVGLSGDWFSGITWLVFSSPFNGLLLWYYKKSIPEKFQS